MGCVLLILAVVRTSRRNVRLWRTSLLPLLCHGLEERTLREQPISADNCGMDHAARQTVVSLVSVDEQKFVLREMPGKRAPA